MSERVFTSDARAQRNKLMHSPASRTVIMRLEPFWVLVPPPPLMLVQYASRMNIKLLRPADFNEKLMEHEVDKKITV